MPLESKVSWAKLRVGVTSIIALTILAVLIWLISGSSGLFQSKAVLYTYMGDAAALAEGAPVRLNGILAGEVSGIGLSGSNDPKRVVKITMQVESRFLNDIPIDSQTGIDAENLLGTKYINITKGRSQQAVQVGAELASQETPELTDFVKQGATTLAAAQGIITRVNEMLQTVESGKGSLGELLFKDDFYLKAMGILDDVQKVTAALNSSNSTFGKLLYTDEYGALLKDTVARANALIDDIDHGPGVVGRLMQDPSMYDDVKKTIADFRSILANIEAGKGTVGKLLYSDEMHDQIKATIARMDTLLDKLNSGEGTLGQLLVNPSLYDSVNGLSRSMQDLLKDFRTNPKKFLHIKVSLF